ncbi:glycoside hydrolase family 38 C-terminal domain-containing protein [Paenibacillus amylolyticus]|nr:glycoside hydrolase family 38 C-terminal domain-containing protein [Paenibacillus amylolyticus]
MQVQISLRKGEKLIRFQVQVQNEVFSHRLRVLFDTGIASRPIHCRSAFRCDCSSNLIARSGGMGARTMAGETNHH